MVKIRYTDLPAGLHVAVQAQGRRTTIYLLPGLTADQRRAALARARSSGHMGQGPVLPPLALARAVAADRTSTLMRNGAAAMRGHPMLLLPPLIVLVSSAIVFILTSFVTLTVRGGGPALAGPRATAPVIGTHPDPDGKHRLPYTGFHLATPPPSGGSSASPAPSNTTTQPGAPSSQPEPTPTITDPPSPTPTPSLVPTPTPTAAPSPTPSSSSSSACIKLGPLGLCVTI